MYVKSTYPHQGVADSPDPPDAADDEGYVPETEEGEDWQWHESVLVSGFFFTNFYSFLFFFFLFLCFFVFVFVSLLFFFFKFVFRFCEFA